MRAPKVIIGVVLGSMVLGTAGTIVARQNAASPAAHAVEAKLAEFKASLARAVSAAEKEVAGIAKSVRIDRSHGEPRWIVGVDAAGKSHEVVVDHGGTVISKTVQVAPAIKSEPETQLGAPAKPATPSGGASGEAQKATPPALAPAAGKAS